jgi:hypothetical protein
MKRAIVVVLLGLMAASLACAQKENAMKRKSAPSAPTVTREYLLAHGFKESADHPGAFAQEHVRLRDVLRDLGFRLSDLSPAVNAQRSNEVLTVEARGMYVLIRPEFRDSKQAMGSGVVEEPLDDVDLLCAVRVWLNSAPRRRNLPTESAPQLTVKSVVVPSDRSKPLQVTFVLTADGKTPLALF